MAEYYELKKEQACTYYCTFDVGAFSRHDLVLRCPKAIAPHMQSSSSTGLGEGKGADRERGPGLPSGPQQGPQETYCGVISEDEAFDDAPPPLNILSYEEEQMGLWTHIVPGTRADGEDIEAFGQHPWHREFLIGWISRQKGGGRKRSLASMDGPSSAKSRSS